jgi:quercetin dioxygenase-like cupin family protein
MGRTLKARITLALWVLFAVLLAATQGGGKGDGSAAATPAATGVTRTVLIGATPDNAPDQSLQLARYVILPGTMLPAHIHPGTQIASIQSGDLTYYVLTGTAEIHRNSAGATPGPVEWLPAGASTVLHPGDAVIEREDMIHYGANLGNEPVVILAATLLDAGAPPSIVQATPVA